LAGAEAEAVRVTLSANAPEGVIETRNVPLPLLVKLIVLGLALREKSVTVMVISSESVKVPSETAKWMLA
jgi:hypothetical protein